MAASPNTPQDLERLDHSLCRAITANQFEDAREIVAQCVALHSNETHSAVLSILERARRLAIIQRSLSATRLAQIAPASQYAANDVPLKQHHSRG